MKLLQSNKGNTIEMTIHGDATLDEVLEEFKGFLRACGYVIPYDQDIDLVDIETKG